MLESVPDSGDTVLDSDSVPAASSDAPADEAEAENGATVIPGFHECFFKSDGNTLYQ